MKESNQVCKFLPNFDNIGRKNRLTKSEGIFQKIPIKSDVHEAINQSQKCNYHINVDFLSS